MSDTLTKQKLAIAKLLPERIELDDRTEWGCSIIPMWIKPSNEILDTEWLQIVRDYIKTLPYESRVSIVSWFKKNSQSSLGCALDILGADVKTLFSALEATGIINTTKE